MTEKVIKLTTDKKPYNDGLQTIYFDSVERGKSINIEIDDKDGSLIDLTGLTVKFAGFKDNNKFFLDTLKQVDQSEGCFTYLLPNEIYKTSGKYNIELWKNDQKIDTTNSFNIHISDDGHSIDDSDYISEIEDIKNQYINIFTQLNDALSNGKKDFGTAIADAKDQMSQLVKEIQDKTKNFNGIYEDMKDQVNKLQVLSDSLTTGSNSIENLKQQINELIKSRDKLNAEFAAIDLTKYALKTEIPSLDGYAKKTDIPDTGDFAKKEDIPSIEGLAKTIDIPDVSNLASKKYVDDAVKDKANKADIPSLDDYVTSEKLSNNLNEKVDKSTLDSYAKFADVEEQLKSYATADAMTKGLATKIDQSSVEELLKSYSTTNEVNKLLDNKASSETVVEVKKSIDNQEKQINSLSDSVKTKAEASDVTANASDVTNLKQEVKELQIKLTSATDEIKELKDKKLFTHFKTQQEAIDWSNNNDGIAVVDD